jgi:hypothetical protein
LIEGRGGHADEIEPLHLCLEGHRGRRVRRFGVGGRPILSAEIGLQVGLCLGPERLEEVCIVRGAGPAAG